MRLLPGSHFSLIFSSGAEKEWLLAQSNMEAASSGLVSATNELSIASMKSKSTSGDMSCQYR